MDPTMSIGISAFKMELWCVLENSDMVFSVKMDDTDHVDDVKGAIKNELCHTLDGIDAPDLTLWKISKSEDEAVKLTRADLEGEKPLDPMNTVQECWTDLTAEIHVFVANPLAAGAKRKRQDHLSGVEDENAKRRRIHEDLEKRQEESFLRARKYAPSTDAMPTKTTGFSANIRQIRTGRPYRNDGYPVSLYHPVFSDFLRDIHDSSFVPEPDLLQEARKLGVAATDYYPAKDDRQQVIVPILQDCLIPVLVVEADRWEQGQTRTKADGVVLTTRPEGPAFRLVLELENEVGSGGADPATRGALSYSRYWSSSKFSRACCLPSFILAIAGPWLCVLGGITLDQSVVQRLTDYIFLGAKWDEEPAMRRVAQVLFTLKRGLARLDDFYRTLPLDHDVQRLYPCIRTYRDPTDAVVEFEYLRPLGAEFGSKLVFLASITSGCQRGQ
ncbi:hypothetical protein FRB99_007016, partial [Tulasnella sp. 403]